MKRRPAVGGSFVEWSTLRVFCGPNSDVVSFVFLRSLLMGNESHPSGVFVRYFDLFLRPRLSFSVFQRFKLLANHHS